jgi:hypothetical protein
MYQMINYSKKYSALVFGILFVIFFSLSCSQNNPNIQEGYIGLCYYDNAGNIEERYYLFIVPSDGDGMEDIEEMIISHKKEGLIWRLSPSDWVSLNADDKIWIGTHHMAMLDGEALPRGVFSAELIDKAGMTGSIQLTFDVRDTPFSFPFFSLENGRYTIQSEYPVHHFICYNRSGEFIQTVTLEQLEGEVSSLSLPNETRTVALWAESPELFLSALTEMKEIE